MCFPFFFVCVCVCVCVWITLGVYSVKNRPKKRKNEMGGFVFHSFVEFVLSCIPFFFFLLVDRRERAVSSLVYHYDEWPCCGLVTSPAELNQQTT
jgi:uncharacterized membrane protein